MIVPADCNVCLKIFKNLSKCKDPEVEISKVSYMRSSIIAVVVGTLGLIGKVSDRLNEGIPGGLCKYQKMYSQVQLRLYEELYVKCV